MVTLIKRVDMIDGYEIETVISCYRDRGAALIACAGLNRTRANYMFYRTENIEVL